MWKTAVPLRQQIASLKSAANLRNQEFSIRRLTTKLNCNSVRTYSSLLEVEGALGEQECFVSWQGTFRFREEGDSSAEESEAYVDFEPYGATVAFEARNLDLLQVVRGRFEEVFGLRQTESLPRVVREAQPTVLVGCHFDASGKAAADKMAQFLRLLGFHRVDIADKFEGRSIPDKVREALDRNAIYIGIITGQRTHEWIQAEASYAVGQGKPIILIQEAESDFTPAILGRDREYISFSNGIEEAFIPLLEALRNIPVVGF